MVKLNNSSNRWYNDITSRYQYDSDESLDDFGPYEGPVVVPPPPPPDPLDEVEPDALLKECDQPSILPIFNGGANGGYGWHEVVGGQHTYYIETNYIGEGDRHFFIPFFVNDISRNQDTVITITVNGNKKWRPKNFRCFKRGTTTSTGTLEYMTASEMRGPLEYVDADTDYNINLTVTPSMVSQFWTNGVRLLYITYRQAEVLGLSGMLLQVKKIVSYLPIGFRIVEKDFFSMQRNSPASWTSSTAASVFDLPPDNLATVYEFDRPLQMKYIIDSQPLKVVGRPQFGSIYSVDGSPLNLLPLQTLGTQNTKFTSVFPIWMNTSKLWTILHDFYMQPKQGVCMVSHNSYGCKVYGVYDMQYTIKDATRGYNY